MGLMSFISRMRHRAGFGVHSPLAYSLVKNALWISPVYRYYAENEITALPLPSGLKKTMRMIYRVAAYLKVNKICVPEQGNGLIEDLAEIGNFECKRSPLPNRECDMLLDFANAYSDADVAEYMSQPDKIVWKTLSGKTDPESLPGNLIFLFSDAYLALSKPGMARTLYVV